MHTFNECVQVYKFFLFLIELFVVRWVIQSELSRKEKNKYRMLTHTYGILNKKKKVMKKLEAGRE